MSVQILSRRTFAAGLSILAGAAPVASAALAHPAACTEVDVIAHRCRVAHQALDEAVAAYESALPPPHFTLDMTFRRPAKFGYTPERRLFDGARPSRVVDDRGYTSTRLVATESTIEGDLHRYRFDRARRRPLYRMRRRAKARAAQIEALEASLRLEELSAEMQVAERGLEEMAQRLFEERGSTMADVMVQAKALSVYASTIRGPHVDHQAGCFGKVLADGLQHVARAA